MKRFLLVLAMVLLPIMAFASPFIVSDPYGLTEIQPTVFEMLMDAATVPIDVLPTIAGNGVTGGIFKYDLQGMTGSHSIRVRACVSDASGRYCSDYAPFAFTILVPPRAPTLRLQK